jgi:hypothetical protein
MELNLKIAGILLILLALGHFTFPKYFNWKSDLSTVSLINRQMMYIHTFFIALVLFLAGLLCLTSSGEIIKSDLGNKLSLGFGIFWVVRLIVQLFGYSSKLWKGKRFETGIHILFLLLWCYLAAVFFYLYLRNKM